MIIKYIKNGDSYGRLIILTGLLVDAPIAVVPFYPDEARHIPAFLLPMVFSVTLGFVLCAVNYGRDYTWTEWQTPLKRSSLNILFIWCYSFALGAVPFIITGKMGVLHALFESVSGWTTTGMSVADVTGLPKVLLFHRSFMQYCGGLGFVLMMAVALQNKRTMPLYNAEGHTEMLRPSLRETTRAIMRIYVGFLAAGVILYASFGMKVFDAICHTMSALSTAGFTTQARSIGQYGSLPLELITVVLMTAGACNFAVLLLLTGRKFRKIIRVTEIRVMLGLIAVFTPLIALNLMTVAGVSGPEGFRQSLFGVTSVFSTTGFSTADYAVWPAFSQGLLVMLMIVGGCAGSTAGGIKISRTYFLIRITRENIRKRVSPAIKTAAPSYGAVRGKAHIDGALIADTFGFVAVYTAVLIAGTLAITLTAGCSLGDALFEFASALGTVGVSNGLTHAGTDAGTLFVEIIGMTLGRLEIFAVFYGLSSLAGLIGRGIRKRS